MLMQAIASLALLPFAAGSSISGSSLDPVAAEPVSGSPAPVIVTIDLSGYQVDPRLVFTTLHRVSLDPQSAASGGVTLNEAVALISLAAASLDQSANALAEADAAVGIARAATDALERSIRAGQAANVNGAVAELGAARLALSTALAQRDAILAAITTDATSGLSESKIAALANVRTSSARWGELPAPYRVVTSDDAALVALREALAAKREATESGEPIPDDAAATLAQWEQIGAVASAIAAHDSNAAMIQASWATAIVSPIEP